MKSMKTKLCTHPSCKHKGELLPLTNKFFAIDNKSKNGFSGWCLECKRQHYYDRINKINNKII